MIPSTYKSKSKDRWVVDLKYFKDKFKKNQIQDKYLKKKH